jgi:translation elongation factor EF-1beta
VTTAVTAGVIRVKPEKPDANYEKIVSKINEKKYLAVEGTEKIREK